MVERDASAAWTAWSNAAEKALSHAFCSAGGLVPPRGLVRGRGSALLCKGVIGGSRVQKLRSGYGDAAGASEVRDISVAPILSLKGQLTAVHSLLESIALAGFTIERALQLNRQWDAIVSRGLTGVLDWDVLLSGPSFGLDEFRKLIADSIAKITEFVRQVVLHRKDFAIRKWRGWVLEDNLVHPYRFPPPPPPPPPLSLAVTLVIQWMGPGCWSIRMILTGTFGRPGCFFSVGEIGVGLILRLFRQLLKISSLCCMKFSSHP